MHWTTPFVGLPYATGGAGPDAWNCWHFVGMVERERFGRALPIAPPLTSLAEIARAFRDGIGGSGWVKVAEPTRDGAVRALLDRPRSGDVALMAHLRHPTHVGVHVDDVAGGSVLHCVEGAGSCLPSLYHLRAARWRITGFYRPSGEL